LYTVESSFNELFGRRNGKADFSAFEFQQKDAGVMTHQEETKNGMSH